MEFLRNFASETENNLYNTKTMDTIPTNPASGAPGKLTTVASNVNPNELRNKIFAISGVALAAAGIGVGTAYALDNSGSSDNDDEEIIIGGEDFDPDAPVVEPAPEPAPASAPQPAPAPAPQPAHQNPQEPAQQTTPEDPAATTTPPVENPAGASLTVIGYMDAEGTVYALNPETGLYVSENGEMWDSHEGLNPVIAIVDDTETVYTITPDATFVSEQGVAFAGETPFPEQDLAPFIAMYGDGQNEGEPAVAAGEEEVVAVRADDSDDDTEIEVTDDIVITEGETPTEDGDILITEVDGMPAIDPDDPTLMTGVAEADDIIAADLTDPTVDF